MRICSGPGCLRAVADSVRFCNECKPSTSTNDGVKDHTSGYDAELDRLRKSPRWQRIARSVIRAQPICARCDSLSAICDHIVPAREAMAQTLLAGQGKIAGYFLRTNLQGLCRKCHWAKTAEDKLHTGDWPDVVAKEATAPKKQYFF